VAPVPFIAAGIAGAPFMRTGWVSMRLGIVVFIVPFMFAYDPGLLAIGDWYVIVLAIFWALVSVFYLSIGLEGYFFRRAPWLERSLFSVAGILLMVPNIWIRLSGIALGVLLLLWQLKTRPKRPQIPTTA